MARAKPKTKKRRKADKIGCELFPQNPPEMRRRLRKAVDGVVKSCDNPQLIDHVDGVPIPSTESVNRIIGLLMNLLYPGYFGKQELDSESLGYHLGSQVKELFELLSYQVACSLRQVCRDRKRLCSTCMDDGQQVAMQLLECLPDLRARLAEDVRAAFDGDPAATSFDEIVFSYPGLYAISVYRAAHQLYKMDVPLLPRIMTEQAHSTTGIDIHPGACIGRHFFIDHGTGIVIGETTEIGERVRIYQGVTLGALSFPTDKKGNVMRGLKRHPTIEEGVTIYSGATILGGKTVVGKGSVVGGNVWLTSSVPAGTTVMMSPPKLQFKQNGARRPVALKKAAKRKTSGKRKQR